MPSAHQQTLTSDDLIKEIETKLEHDIHPKFNELCKNIKNNKDEINILLAILRLIEKPECSLTQDLYNKQIEKAKADPSPLRMLVANLLITIGALILTAAGIVALTVATAGIAAPIAIAAAGTAGLACFGGGFFANLKQDTPLSKELAEMKQAIESPKKGA